MAAEFYSDGKVVRAEVFAHCPFSFIGQGWVGLGNVWGAQATWCAVDLCRCSIVEDTGGVSDDPILQLFTTCVARLASVSQRGVGIEVTA